MKQRLHYILLKLFLFFGKIIPKAMLYRVSRWIMTYYYRHKPKRVEIMHANIKKAYPELTEEEISAFGKKVYEELSYTLAELVLLYHKKLDINSLILNKEEMLHKLQALDQQATNGTIYIMAHYGNWELLGQFMAKNGFDMLGVVKEGKNPLIEQHIARPFRTRYGNRAVGNTAAMIAISKALKAKQRVVLAIDQVVQPPNGVPVHFFGYPTAATKAIAVLKRKYDPLIVPVFLQREAKGFRGIIGEPIETECPQEDPDTEIICMTQHYYDIIETQIRQAPQQWLWLYNRWKEIKFAS